MTDRPRLLAVVPARGGSKRLPRKNVLLLGGRPLIAWTISTALDSAWIDHVMVSTDDPEIADAARSAGADVPWLRPSELSTDTATSTAVLQHALAWFESAHGAVDGVILLQPTSPFRTSSSLRAAVQLWANGDRTRPVVSVSPAAVHPAWCFSTVEGTFSPLLGWDNLQQRSQDLAPAFALNGAIYVLPASSVRSAEAIVRPGVRPFFMDDAEETLDIDTQADWQQAMLIAQRRPTVSGRAADV